MRGYKFLLATGLIALSLSLSACFAPAPTESGNPNGENNSENLDHQFTDRVTSVEDIKRTFQPINAVVACIAGVRFFYNKLLVYEEAFLPFVFRFDFTGKILFRELSIPKAKFTDMYLILSNECAGYGFSASIENSDNAVLASLDKGGEKIRFIAQADGGKISVGNEDVRLVADTAPLIRRILRESNTGPREDSELWDSTSGIVFKYQPVDPNIFGVD